MGSGSSVSAGERRRCDRHGLAVAPDGLCALCRSESLPPPRNYSTWALSGLLLVLLLVSGSAMAYRAVTSLRDAAIAPDHTSPESASTATLPSRLRAAEPAVTEAVMAPQGESMPGIAPLPRPAALAMAASPAVLSPPPAAPLETAKPRSAPSPTELRAALAATPIVMYGTSWCGVCKSARRFMTENGLSYREIDPDATPGGWEHVSQLIGRRAVPVIIIDGEVLSGLSERRLMDAVARSVERRLGVSGVRVKAG
jgi:glutaredoxin